MTLRKRMLGAIQDIETAAKSIDADFQRYAHVGISPDIQRAHDLHMEGLREAYRIIADFGNAPEDFEALLNLRAKSIPAFDAIVNLARQELARSDAPAEEKAA